MVAIIVSGSRDPRLARLRPSDWKHVERYRMAAAPSRIPTTPRPVVFGINWYTAFYRPVLIDGLWMIGTERDWGRVDGGHAIMAMPERRKGEDEPRAYKEIYDQRETPRCVGYSGARALSIQVGYRLDPNALYAEAQRADEWPGEDYDGTSVRAAFDVLRTTGPHTWRSRKTGPERPDLGIDANYWCTSPEQVKAVLGRSTSKFTPLANSWFSAGYPPIVWLPDEAVYRLLREDGEAGYSVTKLELAS